MKPGIAGEGLETAAFGVCAFGKGDANFGDVLLAGFLALAMTRCRLSARTCSVVFGFRSVTVEFMVLLRVELDAPVGPTPFSDSL